VLQNYHTIQIHAWQQFEIVWVTDTLSLPSACCLYCEQVSIYMHFFNASWLWRV